MYAYMYICIHKTNSTEEAAPLAHRACTCTHACPVGRTRLRGNTKRVVGFPTASRAAVIHPSTALRKKDSTKSNQQKKEYPKVP